MQGSQWARRLRAVGVLLIGGIWLAGCSAPARSGASAPAATTAPAPAQPAAAGAPGGGAVAAPTASAAGFDERAVADFYRGKTVRIIVGSAPGGTYDTYSRILARHMPKHLPGNPTIIVENKPGAGSMLA